MGSYSSGFPTAGTNDDDAEDLDNQREEDELYDDDDDDDESDEDVELKEEPGQLIPGLTKELEEALITLVTDFEAESFPVWRFLNRDFFEAESFWKDLQFGFYDANADIWRVPTARDLAKIGDSGQRFTYQTNIYRAFGGAIISSLGQKLPFTRFLPRDFQRDLDVQTADAANDVVPLLEQQNELLLENIHAAYLLFTHGIIGGYNRYVEDAEQFGWKEIPEIAYQKAQLKEAGYECMYCAAFSPASHFQQGGFSSLTGADNVVETPPPIPRITCPNCSRPLGETNYRPPEYGDLPTEVVNKLVPRGQEVMTIHGGLELRLPPWCRKQKQMPYLGLVMEVHVSGLRATYGKRAKGLAGGFGSGPYDSWDRFARLALVEPTVSYYGTSNQNLVTFKRYWLRPSTFWMLDKDKRKQMLKIAPDGIYVAFADHKRLLDARNERMDDHWTLGRAVEGTGAYTPAMGSSVISVQKRFNTVSNFIMEWIEYGAAGAGTFFNANVINYKAMKTHRRAPGMFYPLRMAINQDINHVIREGQPGQIAGEVFRYGEDLRSLGEFMSGAVPTVTGGTEKSLKPTTYISDKESALGRMFTTYLHQRLFWSDFKCKAVRDFARWAPYDEKYTLVGPDGEAQGKIIRLENLQGDIDAIPDTDESFPVLIQDIQKTFVELMNMAPQDQRIAEILGDFDNVPFAKAALGVRQLFIPGIDDDKKQKHEIALLLQGRPSQQVVPNPLTGEDEVKWIPTVPIDPWEDGHPIHILRVKKWAVSSQGLKAKIENPWGYKNVIAHGMMHEDYSYSLLAQQQARMEAAGIQPQNGNEGGGQGGDQTKSSSKSGVRSGQGAGANKREGASGKKSERPTQKGRSDNPSAPGGASPTEQTNEIKAGMQQNLAGGIPS